MIEYFLEGVRELMEDECTTHTNTPHPHPRPHTLTLFFPVYFNKIPSNLMNSLSMEKITIMAISTHTQDT
jgi:hypothetical protein